MEGKKESCKNTVHANCYRSNRFSSALLNVCRKTKLYTKKKALPTYYIDVSVLIA